MNETEITEEESWLNDLWSVYFHDPYNDEWERNSYTKITTISTIKEYNMLYSLLKEHVHQGMFFLMREHIFPKWNDNENKNGGFLSIKILKNKMYDFCNDLFINLINESLLTEEHVSAWSTLNGISVSPKKHFCIVKIWLKTNEYIDPEMYNIPKEYHGEIIYKGNTCT